MIANPITDGGGKTKSVLIDLRGQRFGRQVVLDRAQNDRQGKPQWLCLCDCGTKHVVAGYVLRDGDSRSCGCLRRESARRVAQEYLTTHGLNGTPTHKAWQDMRARCDNPKHRQYPHYGGRGIAVCGRWRQFGNFVADMGLRPGPAYSIDRIDNDRGYSPENCRWATRKQQCRNSRRNRRITVGGVTRCVVEWGELIGIPAKTIRCRLHWGWSPERAVTAPLDVRRRNKHARALDEAHDGQPEDDR